MLPNMSRRKIYAILGLAALVGLGGFIAFKILQQQKAAGGGGTASVTPSIVPASATGETLSFDYTADTTKDSGGLSLDVPTGVGWSTPQGVFGTAGYTTVSSTGGVLGDVEDNMDNPLANWHHTTHQSLSITAGSSGLIGLQELTNDITQYTGAGENWYYDNPTPENWGQANNGADLRVGLFLTSDINTTSGQLSWQDDNNAGLASPEHTAALPAMSAGVGQYVSTTLSAPPTGGSDVTGRKSYGVEYTSDIGAAQVKASQIMPLFDPAESLTNWTSTANASTGIDFGSKEGSKAINCSFTASANPLSGDGCYRTGTAFTIGPGTNVGFWIKPSINLASGDLDWVDSSNPSLVFPADIVPITPSSGSFTAGTWTFVTITAANSGNLSSGSYGIRLANVSGPFSVSIDAMGKIINDTSSLTNWGTNVSSAISLSADGTTKKEGSNSLNIALDGATTPGEFWYRDVATEDWSGYSKVGFWIRSTVNTNAGDLQFVYDDSTALASPINAVNLGALTANTWSWQILTLSSPLAVINSFGIKHTVDIGPATINLDYFLLGPGFATFNGNTINATFLDLKATDTVSIVFGAGGGVNGTSVPGTAGPYTFTLKNKDDSSGTLTALTAGSPVVTVNARPTINSFNDTPDPLVFGNDIAFEANWSDANTAEQAKLLVCRTNLVSTAGTCPGGSWFSSVAYVSTNPLSGTYTTQSADIATSPNNYYLFVCDVKAISNSCSLVNSGTFTVQDISLTLSLSSSNLDFGTLKYDGPRYATVGGGSNTEVEAQTLSAASNTGKGYTITVKGATLTSGTHTITAIGNTNTPPATNTEQFGLRAQVSSGAGTVSVPYSGSGFAYGATASVSDQFATAPFGDAGTTVYSLRYVANIKKSTDIGQYSTALSFVLTASI